MKLILSPFLLAISILDSLHRGYVFGAKRTLENFTEFPVISPKFKMTNFFSIFKSFWKAVDDNLISKDTKYFDATETVAQIAHDYTEKYGKVLVGIDTKIDHRFGSYSNMSFSSEEKLLERVEPEGFVYLEEPSYGTFGLGRALRGVSEEQAQRLPPRCHPELAKDLHGVASKTL